MCSTALISRPSLVRLSLTALRAALPISMPQTARAMRCLCSRLRPLRPDAVPTPPVRPGGATTKRTLRRPVGPPWQRILHDVALVAAPLIPLPSDVSRGSARLPSVWGANDRDGGDRCQGDRAPETSV